MKTRIIYTNFWKDNYISDLSAKEKLSFLYLITNDSVSICGIYQLPDKYICMDLSLNNSEWKQIKEKFTMDQKFYFKDGWIKVMNFTKYNKYAGEKNEMAINKDLLHVPSEIRDFQYSIDTVSIGVSSIADTLNNHNQNHNQYINNNLESVKTFKKVEKYSSIKDIEAIDVLEIAAHYQVPEAFVQSKLDDMKNWLEANGRRYKNYRAALMNWVKKDAMKILDDERKTVNKFSVTKL